MKTAAELFPYLPNENNDTAIREWNQRMYDKREAYNLALSSPEPAMEVEGWIDVKDRLPLAYKLGNFDCKQSDLVLTKSAKDGYNIALVYSGIIDGQVFNDWFDKDDFEISPPDMWKPLT